VWVLSLEQGRRWQEVKGHLENMWVMVLRAMDDIKESCREAAAGAMRSLRSLTLRLADPSATPAADAREAVALMLPFLLETGAPQKRTCQLAGCHIVVLFKSWSTRAKRRQRT
jgi:hypothetical protein